MDRHSQDVDQDLRVITLDNQELKDHLVSQVVWDRKGLRLISLVVLDFLGADVLRVQ